MRGRLGLLVGVALMAIAASGTVARADQPRDFMLGIMPEGDHLMLDYFGTGGQLTLQRNTSIYGKYNELTAGAHTLVGYPLVQGDVYASLRMLFLELGGTVGYRFLWRNLKFEKGKDTYCIDCDRAARRKLDGLLRPSNDTDQLMYAEGRLTLYAPFNDHVTFATQLASRYEGGEDRSYDWFYTSIHDGGVATRWESLLFFMHRDWGAIAPYMQWMFLPRAGKHETEVAFGFNAVRRFGLIERNDLLFLTFLVRPGDRYYGVHNYFSPIRALLVYRMILAL